MTCRSTLVFKASFPSVAAYFKLILAAKETVPIFAHFWRVAAAIVLLFQHLAFM
jgi:hypothetical protein